MWIYDAKHGVWNVSIIKLSPPKSHHALTVFASCPGLSYLNVQRNCNVIMSLGITAKLEQNPWFQELPMDLGEGILVKCAGMCMIWCDDMVKLSIISRFHNSKNYRPQNKHWRCLDNHQQWSQHRSRRSGNHCHWTALGCCRRCIAGNPHCDLCLRLLQILSKMSDLIHSI